MKKIFVFIIAMAMCLSFVACASESTSSSSVPTQSPTVPPSSSSDGTSSSKSSGSSSSGSFTNEYGTETTKCAHSGCNNYIASSGNTNCCTTHSNKCAKCGKYIDEDAMYCMSCLTAASNNSSSSSSKSKSSGSSSSSKSSSSSSSSSKNKCHYKENGKEVCNKTCQSGSNFCSYHTKYLNDIYKSITGGK